MLWSVCRRSTAVRSDPRPRRLVRCVPTGAHARRTSTAASTRPAAKCFSGLTHQLQGFLHHGIRLVELLLELQGQVQVVTDVLGMGAWTNACRYSSMASSSCPIWANTFPKFVNASTDEGSSFKAWR